MKEEKIYRQEAVVPDRGLPFKLFRFEGADGKYICEAHQHSSVEIFALREGKVDFYLGDKKYVLPAGKFIIVNSNEVHSIHTSGRNEAIVLQIPMEKQIMRFSGEKKEEDGKLFALLEKMYRQQIRKEYGYELLMQSIFYQLKYLLVTAYRIPEEKKDYYPGNTQSGHLERITGYLREHYAEEISLETLAATFGCILPSCIIVTVIAKLYLKYRSMEVLQGVLGSLRPAVVAMIASAGILILISAFWGSASAISFEETKWSMVVIFILCVISLRKTKINPVWVMVLAGLMKAGLALTGQWV